VGGKVALDVGVAHGGAGAPSQAIRHREHDPAAGRPALEAAVAIAEPAVGGVEDDHPVVRRVERAHDDDRLAHLLPVGAHVLDGRRAHESGDPAEALEPRPPTLHAQADDVVPRLAGGNRQLHGVAGFAGRHAAQGHLDDETVHAFVGNHQIGSAPEDPERDPPLSGPRQGGPHGFLVERLDEISSGAADAKGAPGRERDVLLGPHARAPGW
jgi:hypothetical protein